MKKIILSFLVFSFFGYMVYAQPMDGGPMDPPPHYDDHFGAPPSPDDSADIEGVWDCGKFGILKLRRERMHSYSGEYGFKSGYLRGHVRGDDFRGRWKQDEDRGDFEFKVLHDPDTDRPSRLRGRWKYRGDRSWRGGWVCERR